MAGIKTYAQTDLRVAPTEETHLVRLKDMVEYVAGMTKSPVAAVLDTNFVGIYNSAGMTLTQTIPTELMVDGVTLAQNDRVLLAGQTDQTQNGIYTVTTLGVMGTTATVLTRAADFNSSTEIINGLIIPVTQGSANAGSRWKLTVGSIPYVLDSTNLVFQKDIADFTKVVEKTFSVTGDSTTTLYDFTHDFNTKHVTHELIENTTGESVVAVFRRTSVNDVEVEFGAPLGTGNDFTLIIRAQVDPV